MGSKARFGEVVAPDARAAAVARERQQPEHPIGVRLQVVDVRIRGAGGAFALVRNRVESIEPGVVAKESFIRTHPDGTVLVLQKGPDEPMHYAVRSRVEGIPYEAPACGVEPVEPVGRPDPDAADPVFE